MKQVDPCRAGRKGMSAAKQGQAIAMAVNGESQLAIAKKLGVDQSTLSKLFSKEHIKQIITDGQAELTVRCLPKVIDNVYWLIDSYRKVDDKGQPVLNREMLNHAWDAHKEVMKSCGITPYPTDSKLVQYIYQDNRQVFMSPVMAEALKNYATSLKLPDKDIALDVVSEP